MIFSFLFSLISALFHGSNKTTYKMQLVQQTSKYEIRQYQSIITASVKNAERHTGFRKLASYIGVMGQANNHQQQKMAMTTPVLSNRITDGNFDMSFILPSDITTKQQAPVPNDSSVVIDQIDKRSVAVRKFGGDYSPQQGYDHLVALMADLKDDKVLKPEIQLAELKWAIAQYDSPWTPSFMKTNEVWIQIS